VCRSQSRLERGFDFSETYADESDPPALTVCDEYAPEVLELFEKASKRCPSVSLDPQVMEGQPCIAGTRIPVRAVLRAVEQYGSVEGALRCYPHLTVDLIKDALYFSQVVLDPSRGIDESATTP
jgi:uncharacterized protein (DUF433 family)